MRDEDKWAALGVRPASALTSERAALVLELPTSGGRYGSTGDHDDDEGVSPAGGDVDDGSWSARPASAGEEIWERKGWNSMDGSWRAFF